MSVSPEYMELATGEVVSTTQKKRYAYPGGYITMGLVNITRLVNAKLPADGYRLALLIAARVAPVSSLCHATNEAYAEELGIRKNRVSELIHLLAETSFICRLNPRLVMVNPHWCFHGTAIQQQDAMQTWTRLHPLGIVERPAGKTA